MECPLCRETISPDWQCEMVGQICLRKCDDKQSVQRQKFLMCLSSSFGELHQYLCKICLLSILQQHVIQNAKMVGSASDLENADVHLAMGVDTVIKVSKAQTSDSLERQEVWKHTNLIWHSSSPGLMHFEIITLIPLTLLSKMCGLEDLRACRRMGWSICTETCCENLRESLSFGKVLCKYSV